LDRASSLARVVVTCDDDYLIEANRRLGNKIYFYGVVYIEDIELIAKVADPVDFKVKGIEYIPYD
jgi:hypothetical protein